MIPAPNEQRQPMLSLSPDAANLLQTVAGWGGVAATVVATILGGLALWAGGEVARHERAAQADLSDRLAVASKEAAEATARLAPRRLNADRNAAFEAMHAAGVREVRMRLINGDAESTQLYNEIAAAFGEANIRVHLLASMMPGGIFGTLVQGTDDAVVNTVSRGLAQSGLPHRTEIAALGDGIPNVLIFPKEAN